MAATARSAAPPGRARATAAPRPAPARTAATSSGRAVSSARGPAITLKAASAKKSPRFQAAIARLGTSAAKAASHPPASKKAAEAQAAATPPANEKLAGANANKTANMAAAETGKPDSNSFLSMLRAEIKKVMPKKTEDAGDFMEGSDRNQLKGAMTGNVQQQKSEATAGMKGATDAPPDTSAVPGKEVTPLPSEGAPPAPPAVDAAQAMPEPKSAQDTSLEQGKQDTAKLLTDAEVTTPQLEKANDPRFTAVVTEKNKADQFAATGPKQFQSKEQKVLAQAAAQASADEKKGLAGFVAVGAAGAQAARGKQLSAKEKDELERKKVTDHIQSIFDRTKTAVDKKIASLDDEVSREFDTGADAAVAKMKKYVEVRFDDRYSGIGGKILKGKDWLLPLPDAVKAWFDQAHEVFLQELDALVVRVAALVERRLKEAKDEIAKGQKEIREYVEGLPANLKSVGKAAENEIQARFDELRQGVDEKKNDLAQKLAQRYKDASEKGEKALQEMKDAHKSLYERVRDAIAEVIKILRDFKNRVLAMLKKAKNAVDLIVADPIGFLKNVLAAIKKGLGQFVDNIWTHLKAGFMAWLFGSLMEAGVEVPKDLSLGSILKLVLQVLGLTYDRLRAKAVKLLGERAVGVIEQVAKFIWTLVTEGPAKLWEMIKEYLSNLKEMIIDAVQEWVITTLIKAAVTKLVSMFNPVGAIIQAILTIYNVVMFLIERINQILAFVESVVNSVYEIATGQIGAAANWIEKALARTIPIIIAFLARLLGITGITEKIIGIIKKIQSKVDQAIDKVIAKVAAGIGKLVGGVKAGVQAVAEWWKKRTPFKTASGASHELYFKGSEKDAVPMVASADPKPIEYKLKEFLEKAGEATATDEMKKEIGRIGKVQKMVKDLAKDPSKTSTVIAEMRALFDVFEPPTTVKKFDLKMKDGNLNGDTVGVHMTVDWLDAAHAKGGTPPSGSALAIVMNRLVTDPGECSPDKYVKGHLLNENLGGKGEAKNLFPITGKANSQHLKSTEKIIKKWVLDKKPTTQWVWYEVKVDNIKAEFPAKGKSSRNFVNATFYCRAVLKDAKGKEKESFLTAVPSVHTKREEAETFTIR